MFSKFLKFHSTRSSLRESVYRCEEFMTQARVGVQLLKGTTADHQVRRARAARSYL